ncbi:hypothetical protein X011_07615 [Mycobacterium tuberculosis variant microti OV254]|nr:hypothetical protein X011_07615 [Mycobacterium tuberculosis variant microti OV254]
MIQVVKSWNYLDRTPKIRLIMRWNCVYAEAGSFLVKRQSMPENFGATELQSLSLIMRRGLK